MTRPTRIQVGPFTFTIEWSPAAWNDARESAVAGWDPDLARAYGYTDRRGCRIWVNPHASVDQQREALLHEVMHACQAVANLPNTGPVTGEDFIGRISPTLLDTLDRNPKLRAFLWP